MPMRARVPGGGVDLGRLPSLRRRAGLVAVREQAPESCVAGRSGLLDGLFARAWLKLRQRIAQPIDQPPYIAHLLTISDDPEVEVPAVAHHRDVESHAVGDH